MSKVWDRLEIAGRLAIKKKDNRSFFLGAIGFRRDGACVTAVNGSPWNAPVKQSHAEARLCNRLDHGAIVYVARINAKGEFAMARPCPNCQRVLRSRGVKKVYYSISNEEYGVFFPMAESRGDLLKKSGKG